MGTELTCGARFLDIELPDHTGATRRLSDLAGDDPVMLHFFRGWWCPKEQTYFRILTALQSEAEVAYTRFVSVSVDEPEVSAAFRAGLDARWTFLCDTDRRWAEELGLMETTDTTHRPYIPTVVTLYPDLTIHGLYDGYWFWGRATADELRRDFRCISAAIRPDWKLER